LTVGCGGDDEAASDTTPELPKLTVPRSDAAPEVTAPPATETAPPVDMETVPPADDGGTPAPETAPPADSPENDTPPPSDSPAERFEEFCNENPGACG